MGLSDRDNNPLACWVTLAELVNLTTCDLQNFLVFSHHPGWVIAPINSLREWSIA